MPSHARLRSWSRRRPGVTPSPGRSAWRQEVEHCRQCTAFFRFATLNLKKISWFIFPDSGIKIVKFLEFSGFGHRGHYPSLGRASGERLDPPESGSGHSEKLSGWTEASAGYGQTEALRNSIAFAAKLSRRIIRSAAEIVGKIFRNSFITLTSTFLRVLHVWVFA